MHDLIFNDGFNDIAINRVDVTHVWCTIPTKLGRMRVIGDAKTNGYFVNHDLSPVHD
jgi:hypothetical protein